MTDDSLKNYVETPMAEKTIEHVTVVLEIKVGEKNQLKEPAFVVDDHSGIVLTDDDEKYLAMIKETLERNKESLGRMCVRYIRPAVFASRDIFSDINLPAHHELKS
ncbi:hypothetical protein BV898_07270 [Hypsibius exemplaris]|uniref:Uncharacterized protein n=1 Tax=Hypsibius exemplaris TaxID=2072580 RepID=A0A1W0WTW9_HYPEX|nr:hypothetical protein BV898_07270 [Hypsibius exemplaris]